MRAMIRKTRACSVEALDEGLKMAIRAHGEKYDLEDIEANILMCCETITVHRRKGILGGLQTTLSAVYVTPKWLVWVESTGRNDIAAGTAQLKYIGVRGYRNTPQYAITPDQGLNIAGRYTDKNQTGMTFIMLDSETDGRKFRQVLEEALGKVTK